jgi:hypothetical protein
LPQDLSVPHQAQNDNCGDSISLPIPAARLRAAASGSPSRGDDRLPPSTSVLIWLLLAVVGWSAVAMAIYLL